MTLDVSLTQVVLDCEWYEVEGAVWQRHIDETFGLVLLIEVPFFRFVIGVVGYVVGRKVDNVDYDLAWFAYAIDSVAFLDAGLHIEIPREASIHQKMVYAKARHVCCLEKEWHGGGADDSAGDFLLIRKIIECKIHVHASLRIVGRDKHSLLVVYSFLLQCFDHKVMQRGVVEEAASAREALNRVEWVP